MRTGQLEAMGVKVELDKSYNENFPKGCLSEILKPALVKLNIFNNHYVSLTSRWLDNVTGVARKIDNLSNIKQSSLNLLRIDCEIEHVVMNEPQRFLYQSDMKENYFRQEYFTAKQNKTIKQKFVVQNEFKINMVYQ